MVKKKNLLVMLVIIILLLIAFYFCYYFFILKDEKNEIFSSLDIDNSSIEFSIANLDSEDGYIQYCHFNNCNKYLYLPFESIEENDFSGFGKYRVEFNFSQYLLYPWGNKQKIESWSIKEMKDNVFIEPQKYLTTLKQLLSDKYLWEVYLIPVSSAPENFGDAGNIEYVGLDFQYTKSLYLLHRLFNKLKDQELEQAFNREIEYLNGNVEIVINDNQEIMMFPEAYILELVELGLTEEYLSFITEYEVPESFEDILNFEDANKGVAELGEDYYTFDYKHIISYVDYYKIFSKYGYDDLAKYSYNQMINIYNMSDYKVYGLCSIANAKKDLISGEHLSDILEPILSNNQTELVEGNLYELIMCDMFAREEDVTIEGLDYLIKRLVNTMTMDINGEKVLVSELEGIDSSTGETLVIRGYDILNLLLYLLNEV
jgi:hypothetical protein